MDLYKLMGTLDRALEDLDYDIHSVEGILVKRDGSFQIRYDAVDDFQSSLDYDERVKSGYGQSFYFKDEAEFLEQLAEIPSRETREFRVLLRRTAGLKLLSDAMVGAAGRAFAAEMAATLEKYKLLESE